MLVDWVILRSEPGWLSSFSGREVAAVCPTFLEDVARTAVAWDRLHGGGEGWKRGNSPGGVGGAGEDGGGCGRWNHCAYHWHDGNFPGEACVYEGEKGVLMPSEAARELRS